MALTTTDLKRGIIARDVEIARLQAALDEIGRVATSCWMDMQGRLVDDEHRRVHGVLGGIATTAAAALPKITT